MKHELTSEFAVRISATAAPVGKTHQLQVRGYAYGATFYFSVSRYASRPSPEVHLVVQRREEGQVVEAQKLSTSLDLVFKSELPRVFGELFIAGGMDPLIATVASEDAAGEFADRALEDWAHLSSKPAPEAFKHISYSHFLERGRELNFAMSHRLLEYLNMPEGAIS